MKSNEELDLSSRLGWWGAVDRFVYRCEVLVVVVALAAMSVLVFTDVVYQLVMSITESDRHGLAAGILLFVGWMAFAATGDNRVESDGADDGDRDEGTALPFVARFFVALGVVLFVVGVSWSMLHAESATVYRVVLFGLSIPIARILWQAQRRVGLALFVVSAGAGAVLCGFLPTGYAWSQSYSLVMLLWVGFLGASIAAMKRRHLRVDLVRKLLSPEKLPWFNAVSYTFAAVFTGLIFYLGVTYLFGHESSYLRPIWDVPAWLPAAWQAELTSGFPLAEDASLLRRMGQVFFAPSEPGEIPDWLKALAVPVSMFLIMVRFLGHALVFARMGLRGEAFVEETGGH